MSSVTRITCAAHRVDHAAAASAGRRSPCRRGPSSRLLRSATSKSWLMPIDSSASCGAGAPSRDQRVAQVAQPPEPRSRVLGIVRNRRHDHQAARSTRAGVERGVDEVGERRPRRRRAWWPRGRDRPESGCAAARPARRRPRRLCAAARASRSNESTRTRATAFFALLDCRWPMRCHSSGEVGAARRSCRAPSWTRFSPNARCPAAAASRTRRRGRSWRRR